MRRRQDKNELEARWKRNRKLREHPHHSFVTIHKKAGGYFSQHRPAKRPKKLRGDDFVCELARLGGVWWDERFLNCVQALFDHGIVRIKDDGKCEFTGKKEPAKQQIAARKQQYDSDCVAQVHALVGPMSVRSACDKVATDAGYPGKDWAAASDRLRKLYQKRFSKHQ